MQPCINTNLVSMVCSLSDRQHDIYTGRVIAKSSAIYDLQVWFTIGTILKKTSSTSDDFYRTYISLEALNDYGRSRAHCRRLKNASCK